MTFLLTIGLSYWNVIAGLAIGGAYAVRRVPRRPMMVAVGIVIVALSLNVLLRL